MNQRSANMIFQISYAVHNHYKIESNYHDCNNSQNIICINDRLLGNC